MPKRKTIGFPKQKVSGSSTRKPKVNLSNTYGIVNTSKGGFGNGAVTQSRKGKPLSRGKAIKKATG